MRAGTFHENRLHAQGLESVHRSSSTRPRRGTCSSDGFSLTATAKQQGFHDSSGLVECDLDYTLNVFWWSASDQLDLASPSAIINPMGEPTPLLCHRCGCDLKLGEGNFYVVRILGLICPRACLCPGNLQSRKRFRLS